MTMINSAILLREIEVAFPPVEMPEKSGLTEHGDDCFECEHLQNDIDEYRNRKIDGEAIRLVHQEMSKLSAKTWRWLLPHYLKHCLTPEAEYSRMETEFLIYSLGPAPEFQEVALQRLSLLSKDQLDCVTHFLEWCREHPHWGDYFPEDIAKAVNFLALARSIRLAPPPTTV